MTSLSVIVASGGRASLGRTLASVTPQLTVEDQLLLLVDQRAPFGHASRNLMMGWATGEYLTFLDDDEEWTPDAAETIRRAVAASPRVALLFEVDGPPGTGGIVVPNTPPRACWGGDERGAAEFVLRVARRLTVLKYPQVVVRHQRV